MHRVGRTGRFGLKGIAVNLLAPDEVPMVEAIRQHYRCEIEELPLDPEMIHKMASDLR